MAERRMISKTFLMDNRFLKLSNDTKTLYVYLLSFADDDGIVARSIMIDNTLGVNDDNYKSLEANGLIIPFNEEIKVITDWNSLQSIRKDIYTPTSYLDLRSQLFIKSNYSYTKDGNETGVFSTVDNWIRNGRPKDIRNFQPLINKYLEDRNGTRNDNRNPSKVKYSKDKLSLDKISIGKLRLDKNSTDKDSTDTKYLHTSSNGGMGEDASNDSVGGVINYIQSIFQIDEASDNKRLNIFLNQLTDEYDTKYIEEALRSLRSEMEELIEVSNPNQIINMIIDHLREHLTAVIQAEV